MSDTATMLLATPGLPARHALYEILGHDRVQYVYDGDVVTQYVITWDDLTLTLRRIIPPELGAITETVEAWLDGREDRRALKIVRRLERIEQVIDVQATPGWDDAQRAERFLLAFIAEYNYGFLYTGEALYNENGNRLLGMEDTPHKLFPQPQAESDESKAARERKQRSIAVLKREDVPYIDHLPGIPDEEQAILRDTEAIALRALGIFAVAEYAETRSKEQLAARIQQYQLTDVFTPQEREFTTSDDPEDIEIIKFQQRYEALWALLWALGYVHTLGRPDYFVDMPQLREIIETRSRATFLMDAARRPLSDVLDTLDLTLRYDWAVMDAELYGNPVPANLKAAVAYERHYALKWVTGYQDQAWDEVTADL